MSETDYINRDVHDQVNRRVMAACALINARVHLDAMPDGPLKTALLDRWRKWRDLFEETENEA